jgi:thymidine phosphorylase
MSSFDMRTLIRRKRDGLEHSAAELQDMVQAAVAGAVPDYQLSAWLMAVCFTHLSEAETFALTQSFVDSGETLRWDGLDRPVVDKHSTGGVGDKVSLALAPWLAAAGLAVPKMSGRGLGHTGGTLDKLAAIPGFDTGLDQAGMRRLLREVGCCIASQSAALVPADQLFYALRDATETVEERGLIAASVMSKKLACGAPGIVLDVKCGRGAFFRDAAAARDFAELACRIGAQAGRRVSCVLSPMDQPLGRAVGNALEVKEAADLLSGRRDSPELREACLALGAEALRIAAATSPPAGPDGGAPGPVGLELAPAADDAAWAEHARPLLERLLVSGAAWQHFQRWIAAQGGDWAEFERQAEEERGRCRQVMVRAEARGWIAGLDALAVGELACDLGAGRRTKDDIINPWVGIECLAKTGERVEAGQAIARLTVQPDDARKDGVLSEAYLAAVTVADHEPSRQQMILEVVRSK